MSAARSAPSGPAVTPEGGSLTQARIASANVAAAARSNLSVVTVPSQGGSYLISADALAAAASATTTGQYEVNWTPTGGALTTLFSRSLTVATAAEAFRLQSLIAKVNGPGELAVAVENTGAQQLNLTLVDVQIQPLTITT